MNDTGRAESLGSPQVDPSPASNLTAASDAPPAAALSVDERVRLMRDGIINYSGYLVSGLVAIVLVPILLNGLGTELYGLWIATQVVAALPAGLDLGLGMSVTREIAASSDPRAREETARFVTSAGTAFLLFGLVGGGMIAALGLPLSGALRLSPEGLRIAPTVFALCGVGFFADQMLAFTGAVFLGLRRFDIANARAIAAVLVRAAGIIAVLGLGGNLVAVALWQVVASLTAAAATLVLMGRLEPLYRFSLGRFNWPSVRARVPFSLKSQLVIAAVKAVWEPPAILIGVVRGSAAIVPYHIGQKFPVAVSHLAWSAAEALFPAASEEEQAKDLSRTRQILEVGTRWLMVMVLPLTVLLWIVAPNLLQAWVGPVPPETVGVFRLIVAAVLVDALGAGAMYLLWGRGAAGTVLAVLSCVAGLQFGLGLWLLVRIGVVGMAWAMFVAMTVGAGAFLVVVGRACNVSPLGLVIRTLRGLMLPLVASALVALAIMFLARPGRWPEVVAAALAGGVVYTLILYFGGAREEERVLAREFLALPAKIAQSLYHLLRRTLRRVTFIRSTWYLLLALKETALDSPNRNREMVDLDYGRTTDPWSYNTSPTERERFARQVELLDAARGESPFKEALEIGCAEGVFTELLAERCESLLALDLSPVALARARERLKSRNHIRFAEFDLRRENLPGTFDLIVITGVLEYFLRPSAVRAARAKLVDGLRPGGTLLVMTTRANQVAENAWWGRLLIRGRWVNEFIGRHPALKEVRSISGDWYIISLFQKV